MKIAITGHSRGIGKGLCDALGNKGHMVLGFSRSNGYNTNEENDRQRILDAVKECDIFINNAYPGQAEMFEKIFQLWRDDYNKTIVNIGSLLKYKEFVTPNDYTVMKWNLYKSTLKPIFKREKSCRLMCFNPGYVDTDMIKSNKDAKKMTVEECVTIMCWAIEQPQHIEIAELSFWLTNI